jgi:hypothetical protein
MADIAPKLVSLSADKLRSLHTRLHKSELTSEVLEVHHLVLNEALRRGLEPFEKDEWDNYEIQIDFLENVDLLDLGATLPKELVDEVIKATGTSIGSVRTVLTTTGYQLKIDPIFEPVNKMIREEDDKWVVYDKTGKSKLGEYDSKDEAEERLAQIHRFAKADNKPPKAVRASARRALDWISAGLAGDGFTSVGRFRASQLAAGESVSIDTLKRMKSFFSRHEVDKQALGFSQGEKGYPSAGRVAWDAWGGDAGFAWAESMVEQYDKVEKHNQGTHDQKTHGKWADTIAQEILNGGHPEVEPENLSALLMKMATRTDHPDITELSIQGTLLYGDEGLGIARKDMPQIPKKERARFLGDIEKSEGISVEKEQVNPTKLKPIQKEISGSRSGAIYNKFRDKGDIPKNERILISSDGYIVDGHHTWGASVAFAFDNPGTKLPVYRLSVTAEKALAVASQWSKDNGFEGQAIDAPAKKSAFIYQNLSLQDTGADESVSTGTYEVSKAEGEKRYTLGAMYIPDRLDAHSEWTDSDELQRAVWDYVRTNDRRIRLQHDKEVIAGEWVEVMSFPYELTVPITSISGIPTNHTYPPNTVFLGVIWEPWAWEKIKAGEILGYSIGGKAERLYVDMEPVEKDDGPTVNSVHVDTIMNPKKKKRVADEIK